MDWLDIFGNTEEKADIIKKESIVVVGADKALKSKISRLTLAQGVTISFVKDVEYLVNVLKEGRPGGIVLVNAASSVEQMEEDVKVILTQFGNTIIIPIVKEMQIKAILKSSISNVFTDVLIHSASLKRFTSVIKRTLDKRQNLQSGKLAPQVTEPSHIPQYLLLNSPEAQFSYDKKGIIQT
ncbi:MAG: hypothetical protein GF313_05130, partial [Caldithrix sp.]|nr:hypothetical protein [Caldithrix sp.]